MNIAFYVSGNATRLKKLLRIWDLAASLKWGAKSGAQISLVLTDHGRNSELRKLCEARGIPLLEKDLATVPKARRSDEISSTLLTELESRKIEYCFLFCDRILTGEILKRYENRIMNFHPSILPHYKGLLSIDQALKDGATLLGNTAHVVRDEVDSGPILLQSVMHRSRYSDYDDVLDLQIPMLLQLLHWLKAGRVRIGATEAAIEGATFSGGDFYPALELDAGEILRAVRESATKS